MDSTVATDLTFTRSDYDIRLDAVRRRMEKAGLDLLLCTDPANMHYLTGYDGWSFYVPQLVAIPGSGGDPHWIGRGIDANGARVTTYLGDDHIHAYADTFVQARDRHPFDFIAETLCGLGHDRARIGLEMDSYYFSPAGMEALKRGLPNARFADSDRLVNWVRSVKSDKEIALMHRAGAIMDRVMATAIDAIAPGVRQCDAAAAILAAQVRGTESFGGDYTSIVPMLPTGIGTSTPHLTWSDEVFKTGEATIIEIGAAHRHYHCPQARTVFLGTPPQRLADTADVVVEGLGEALSAVRPGATCEDVEAAWRRSIAKSGLVKESRIGYSIGVNYPPDWGEHTMSLRPGDRTELESGMCFHCIPGIWQDDWGIEVSEAFRITENGAVPFANTPRQLFVKP